MGVNGGRKFGDGKAFYVVGEVRQEVAQCTKGCCPGLGFDGVHLNAQVVGYILFGRMVFFGIEIH